MNKKQIIAALTHRGINFDPQASVAELNLLLRASWMQVRNSDDPEISSDYDFEITINGQIGTDYYGDEGFSAKQFQDAIKPFKGKRGLLNIHSGGGNIWDGFAIAEMVRAHGNIDTKILGLAASAADVIFQAGQFRFMPQMAMRMGHCASALFQVAGNAKELTAAKGEIDKLIGRLEKHDGTLATMYAQRSGQTAAEVKSDMEAEEFMDGDESLEKGYCDQLTSEIPITDSLDLSHLKKVPAAILNTFKNSASQEAGKQKTKQQDNTVNKQQKIALLNSWGVKLPAGVTAETVTDTWLDDEIAKGKPATKISREQNVALLNSWGVTFGEKETDEQIENRVASGKPKAAQNSNGNIVDLDSHPTVVAMRNQMALARRSQIRSRLDQFVSEDRIPAGQIQDWENDAFAATDDPVKGNPVLNRLAELPAKPPGIQSIGNIEVGDSTSLPDVDKAIKNLLRPQREIQNRADPMVAQNISQSSKQISSLLNRLKKFDANGMLIGPLRDAYDRMASGMSIQNTNSMSSDLLRQLILSEFMRAFKRQFASLNCFAHNYGSVALQGNDYVKVPYYPLNTTASTEYAQANGYVVSANATTSAKSILVGGVGDGVATSGSGRKYQGLKFSAYEMARQPWLNMAQLIVMQAEQLAIDVRADIIGTHVKAANFGNAIYSGAAGGFDSSVVSQNLLNAALKAFWPAGMRNMVLSVDFYTALAADPYVKAFLNIGDTGTIREGKIGGLYGFQDTIPDAVLPIATFIRGGDGTVTAGADLLSAGFICYPSAVLVATAPIMPGPATLRLLAAYEQVTDDQTGLAFTYQYFGDPSASVDKEVIECAYGSGLGEAAALKRLVTGGV